MWRVVINLVGD